MNNEWRELKTLQEVAAAQAAGEEIEQCAGNGWSKWSGNSWSLSYKLRSRPKKKTRTRKYRKAAFHTEIREVVFPDGDTFDGFICWLDTPPREVEVPE